MKPVGLILLGSIILNVACTKAKEEATSNSSQNVVGGAVPQGNSPIAEIDSESNEILVAQEEVIEVLDFDLDGIADAIDEDDDNDGTKDINDLYPLDAERSTVDLELPTTNTAYISGYRYQSYNNLMIGSHPLASVLHVELFEFLNIEAVAKKVHWRMAPNYFKDQPAHVKEGEQIVCVKIFYDNEVDVKDHACFIKMDLFGGMNLGNIANWTTSEMVSLSGAYIRKIGSMSSHSKMRIMIGTTNTYAYDGIVDPQNLGAIPQDLIDSGVPMELDPSYAEQRLTRDIIYGNNISCFRYRYNGALKGRSKLCSFNLSETGVITSIINR